MLKEYKIKDICKKIFSGGTPSTANNSYWVGSNHWLSSGETRDNFITSTNKFISNEAVLHSSTKLAEIDDILIATAGQGFTRGQTSYNLINTYINQSIIGLRVNFLIADPKYIYYNLKSRYDELRGLSDSNSIRGSITIDLINNLNIFLPSLDIQRHIVDTMSTLFLIFLLLFLLTLYFLQVILVIRQMRP